jgi:predicted N-acetyltransferase YhbS
VDGTRHWPAVQATDFQVIPSDLSLQAILSEFTRNRRPMLRPLAGGGWLGYFAHRVAMKLNNLRLRFGELQDAQPIAELVNQAFLAERPFIDGDRTNPQNIRELINKGKFLLAEDSERIVGCVYVESRGERWYLGLLSVELSRQRSGLGSHLMRAAEDHSRSAGATAMDLRIVNLRAELLKFYARLGYEETGRVPLPPDAAAKQPCHFIQMSKKLT